MATILDGKKKAQKIESLLKARVLKMKEKPKLVIIQAGDLEESNIYIRSNGTFIVKVYIDSILISTFNITGNQVHELTPPQEKQRGSDLQFAITGTGVIYEIEYKVVGRQNGR